jgi:hypothetical protein
VADIYQCSQLPRTAQILSLGEGFVISVDLLEAHSLLKIGNIIFAISFGQDAGPLSLMESLLYLSWPVSPALGH